MSFIVTRQSDDVLPPIANSVVAINTNTTATVIDLTSFPLSVAVVRNTPKINNPLGTYFSLQAQGGDVYVLFAATSGAANAIATTVGATVNANTFKITVSNTDAVLLPNAMTMTVRLPPGGGNTSAAWGTGSQARYLALKTAAGTVTVRMWQSSPP